LKLTFNLCRRSGADVRSNSPKGMNEAAIEGLFEALKLEWGPLL
jgi:hypothetical protein